MIVHNAKGGDDDDVLSTINGSNLNDAIPTFYDDGDLISIHGC